MARGGIHAFADAGPGEVRVAVDVRATCCSKGSRAVDRETRSRGSTTRRARRFGGTGVSSARSRGSSPTAPHGRSRSRTAVAGCAEHLGRPDSVARCRDGPLNLALVAVTAIWGYTFVPVQEALAVYPLFAFLALRFAIPDRRAGPIRLGSLRELPRTGWLAGLAGRCSRLRTGCRPRARADDRHEHRLHHRALRQSHAASRARVPHARAGPRLGRGRARRGRAPLLLSGAPEGRGSGTCSSSGTPSRSRSRSSRAATAPRYDPRALTFLQMRRQCSPGSRCVRRRGGPGRGPPDAQTCWYALVVTGVFAGALGYLVATCEVGQRRHGPRRPRWKRCSRALFGVLLLSEHLGWAGWAGCSVMLTGSSSPSRPRPQPPAARPDTR